MKNRLDPMPLRNRPEDSVARRATADLRSQLPIERTGSGYAESGVPELAWLRGHQAGVYDAYLAILEMGLPDTAALLLKKFGMNHDRSIAVMK